MKSPLVFLATCTQNSDTGTVPVIKLTVFIVAVANSRVENKIKVEII